MEQRHRIYPIFDRTDRVLGPGARERLKVASCLFVNPHSSINEEVGRLLAMSGIGTLLIPPSEGCNIILGGYKITKIERYEKVEDVLGNNTDGTPFVAFLDVGCGSFTSFSPILQMLEKCNIPVLVLEGQGLRWMGEESGDVQEEESSPFIPTDAAQNPAISVLWGARSAHQILLRLIQQKE